jgi:hypothetical protein
VVPGGVASIVIPGLHSAWEAFKRAFNPSEVSPEDDPETGIPIVLTVGPGIVIAGTLASIIRASLC